MSNPSLIARLGITDEDFKRGMNASRQGLKAFQEDVKVTAAGMALLERKMAEAGFGTLEQGKQYKALANHLRDVQAEARAAARQLQALDDVAPPKADASHDGKAGTGRSANQEAGHSVRAVFDMLSAGQDPGRALQMELPRLLQAAGKGLGAMIGIDAGVMIGKAVTTAIYETIKERLSVANALAGPTGSGQQYSTTGDLSKEMKELDAKRDELLANSGPNQTGENTSGYGAFWRGLKNIVRTRTGQKSVEDEHDDQMEDLDTKRIALSAEIARRKKEEADLAERAFHHGEHSVASDREKLRLLEEERKVFETPGLDGTAAFKIVDALREESKLRQEHIRLVHEKALAEIEARKGLLQDRADGSETDVTKAERALTEAKRKREGEVTGTPAAVAADDAIKKAELDLRDAKQQTAEKLEQLRITREIANIDAAAPVKDRKRLNEEKRALMEQLREGSPTYQPNALKQGEINTEIAQKDADLRALNRADKDREFQRRREQIDAEVRNGLRGAKRTRPGSLASLDAIDDKLALNAEESTYNAPGSGNRGFQDLQIASRLTAEATELRRQKQGILDADAKELRSAQEVTREMELQSKGEDKAAKEARTRAGYEERIAAALKDGKDQLAAQLQKQQALSLLDQEIENALQTPEERAAKKQKDDRRAFVTGQVNNLHQRHDDATRANNPDADFMARFHGKEGIPKLLKRSDETDGATTNPDHPWVSPLLASAIPKPVLTVPNRTADIMAGAANAGKGDVPTFNDANICSGLRDVVNAVNAISLVNK